MSQTLAHDDAFVCQYRELGEAVCNALINEGKKLGFGENQLPPITWESLKFTLVKDPADGSDCLSGDWFNESGYRRGSFQLNGNGSFFAEHDLVLPHPGDKRWFVEAVTAWGKEGRIITEPRLLEAP